MIFQLWTLLAFVVTFGCSKTVTGIFDQLRGVESKNNRDPERRFTFHWRIPSFRCWTGDVFYLDVPCVRLVQPFEIKNGNTVRAKCAYESGGKSDSGKIKCTTTRGVNYWSSSQGCVKIVMVMGEVRSSSAFDLSYGNCFAPGNNQLRFRHGYREFKTNVVFDRSEVVRDGDRILKRWSPNGFYYKPSSCAYGYESLDVQLNSNTGVDCSSVASSFANPWTGFNGFGLPKSLNAASDARRSCQLLNAVTIRFGKIGYGQQPVLFWNGRLENRGSWITVKEIKHCVNENEQKQVIDKWVLAIGSNNWTPSQNC